MYYTFVRDLSSNLSLSSFVFAVSLYMVFLHALSSLKRVMVIVVLDGFHTLCKACDMSSIRKSNSNYIRVGPLPWLILPRSHLKVQCLPVTLPPHPDHYPIAYYAPYTAV